MIGTLILTTFNCILGSLEGYKEYMPSNRRTRSSIESNSLLISSSRAEQEHKSDPDSMDTSSTCGMFGWLCAAKATERVG